MGVCLSVISAGFLFHYDYYVPSFPMEGSAQESEAVKSKSRPLNPGINRLGHGLITGQPLEKATVLTAQNKDERP